MTLDRDIRKAIVIPGSGADPSVGAERLALYNPDGTPMTVNQEALVGEMKMWAGTTAPDGWQLCNGGVAGSADLLAFLDAQGRPFGGGAGAGLVPDMRGRVPVGVGTHADVNALSDNDGVATVANRTPWHLHSQPAHTHTGPAHTHTQPAHTHSVPSHSHTLPSTNRNNVSNLQPTADAGNTGTSGPWTSGSGGGEDTGSSGTGATGSSGGDNTGTNSPPYQAINFIIRM